MKQHVQCSCISEVPAVVSRRLCHPTSLAAVSTATPWCDPGRQARSGAEGLQAPGAGAGAGLCADVHISQGVPRTTLIRVVSVLDCEIEIGSCFFFLHPLQFKDLFSGKQTDLNIILPKFT